MLVDNAVAPVLVKAPEAGTANNSTLVVDTFSMLGRAGGVPLTGVARHTGIL